MTAGSLQVRRFVAAMRAGVPVETAANENGIGLAEARSYQADEAKGLLDWVGPVPAPAVIGHNSRKDETMSIKDDSLRLFIERIERLEDEKRGISDDVKDVYAEAKATGYDPKIMRIIVRDRRMDADARATRDALVETYSAALGMLADLPLGQAALRSVV